jgi:hypothetical protein
MAPVSADQYRITITVSREMKDLLSRAQDLFRHRIPDGDPAAVLFQGLRVAVEQLERRKLGGGKSKGKARPTRPGSRHIPAAVRSAVWNRDGGRCAFRAKGGRRCAETGGIDRGRDAGCPAPPAQIRACTSRALGSCLR